MAEKLPTPMIRGEQVWLRAMERRDLEAFERGRNDLDIGGTAGFYYPESMTQIEKWYEGLMSEGHGKNGFYLTICRIGSDELVGFAWLMNIDYKNGNAEFRIMLSDTDLMGKGLGTDALNAVLDFGFDNLPLERIYLSVRKDNARAVRSYEKAGMVVEGTLRREVRFGGKLVDGIKMSILREEWESLERRKRA